MSTAEQLEALTKELAESKRELAELRKIVSRLQEGARSKSISSPNGTEPQGDFDRRFHALVENWYAGRGATSSVEKMAMHPAYQQIIGMGQRAVPLLLAELERRPSHWFWALYAITGATPVPEESRGRVKEMAEAWLRWGREHGYTW